MPLDLGPLVGQPAFEQARGVLMQRCGFTADEAMTAIRKAAQRTGAAPKDLVAAILTTPMLAIRRLDLCAYAASYVPPSEA